MDTHQQTQEGTITSTEITTNVLAELPKSKAEQIVTVEEKSRGKGAFSKWDRTFNEKDVENATLAPVIAKFLLNNCDELERKVSYLEDFEKKFHEIDKQCAVLSSKVLSESKFQILYTSAITAAGIVIGIATSSTYSDLIRWVLGGSGIALLCLGVGLNWKMNK